jgi:formate dehydrogenase subunit gamma
MPTLEDPVRLATEQALGRHAGQPGNLMPILHDIQHQLGHIPEAAVPMLANALQLSRAEVHGVISFYPHFRQAAPAGITLEICRAESCQAMGANTLIDHTRKKLGCDFHEHSTDGKVALEPVYCLGLCAQSPAIMLNGQPHARITPSKIDRLLAEKGV